MTKKTSEISKITGASKSVIDKSGNTILKLSPFNPSDLGDIAIWLEDQPIRTAKRKIELLGDMCTPVRREKILDEALDESEKRSDSTSDYAQEKLNAIESVRYMLFLSARKAQPDLTQEECDKLVTFDTLQEFKDKLDEVNQLFGPPKETGEN